MPTAVFCASGYDDLTQFSMFEQKSEHLKSRWTFGGPFGQKKTETKVYLPVYDPTKQETLWDRSREVDKARSTSLNVQCKHAASSIYLTS